MLLNWGAGALTVATNASDAATALPMLEEAAARLRESVSFDRGDPAPHTALGETLAAKAEWLQRGGDAQGASAALSAALKEGYGMALRINATHADALVGVAEVLAQKARAEPTAQAGWEAATAAYLTAASRPEALGDRAQRSDVRYNMACCMVGCGRAEEAASVVRQLISGGSVAAADVATDPDLAPLLHLL